MHPAQDTAAACISGGELFKDVVCPLPSGKVTINVSGQRFVVSADILQLHAGARLANLRKSDPGYDADSGQFFFDRNALAFACVLDYYRTGHLHLQGNVCKEALKEELLFWGFDYVAMSRCPCCDHESSMDSHNVESGLTYFDCRYTLPKPCSEADFLKYQIWYALTESSLVVQQYRQVAYLWPAVYSLFSVLLFLVISLSTVKSMHEIAIDNTTLNLLDYGKTEWPSVSRPKSWINVLFVLCCVYFAVEFTIRLMLCPNKVLMFRAATTYLDIVLLLSALGVMAIIAVSKQHEVPGLYWTLKACQMARVVRFIAYTSQFRGVKVLLLTIRYSIMEMLTLWCLVILNAMVFSTLSFFADIFSEGGITDMLTGLWWATVTMTTVGYGDVVPNTALAKVIGGICALSGLIIVALPIAVIGQNYISIWQQALAHDSKQTRANIGLKSSMEGGRENAPHPVSRILKR